MNAAVQATCLKARAFALADEARIAAMLQRIWIIPLYSQKNANRTPCKDD
jgi:hypothetical protein